MRSGHGMLKVCLVTGWNRTCWSISWKVSRPKCSVAGSPVRTTTGAYANFA